VLIVFDEERKQMVDTDNGDYLNAVLQHYSIPETTFELCNKQGKAFLVADLIDEVTDLETSEGTISLKKWVLIKAWQPGMNIPFQTPTNFGVSQILIDRLALFLRRLMETRWSFGKVPRQFEFVDARKDVGPATS
jgi:hypothetical protein